MARILIIYIKNKAKSLKTFSYNKNIHRLCQLYDIDTIPKFLLSYQYTITISGGANWVTSPGAVSFR